jgi:hypothetical protein
VVSPEFYCLVLDFIELINYAVSEKRGSKGLKFFMWRRKSKQQQAEKEEAKEEAAAQEAAAEKPTEEAPVAQGAVVAPEAEKPTEEAPVAQAAVVAPEAEEVPAAALEVQQPTDTVAAAAAPEAQQPTDIVAAAPEPKAEANAENEGEPAPREAARQIDSVPDTAGTTRIESAAPISSPVSLTYEPTQDDGRPGMLGSQTGPRDAAATGGVSAMHNIQPITSPRADSKLKTWFRDRLVRRTSEPQPVYPHQPGPEYNTDSETAFTGGAALTGRTEPRGAALSSHPVSTEDLESEHGEDGAVPKSSTEEAATTHNGNSSANGKRHRLRRSFMKSVSRNSQDIKTNGAEHKRQSSEAVEPTSDLQGLRDSAAEQGLPAPPVLGDSLSIHRESRFSEDL